MSGYSNKDPTYPTPPTGAHINVAERYDTASDTWMTVNACPAPDTQSLWVTKNTMPTKRGGHAVAAVGNKIYINGGTNGGGVGMATFERYDPDTDAWVSINSTPTARYSLAFAAFSTRYKVYHPFFPTTFDCQCL